MLDKRADPLFYVLATLLTRFGPLRADADGSYQALQVRPHHIGHAADFGVAPDLVTGHAAGSLRRAQRLQSNIQADLVAVLETVRHRLGDARDANGHPVDDVLLGALGERQTREADEA